MWRPKLNPITRKRLKRFRALKRSYYSFMLLMGLYGLSLVSETIAGNQPLVARYEGKWFFPIFFYYPESAFSESGLNTRPNYRKLSQSPAFAESNDNWMLFPPVPFGPNEGITANDLDVEDDVSVHIRRKQLVGSVDIDAALQIQRSVAAAAFFGASSDRELRGRALGELYPVSNAFASAVAARFANDAALPHLDESATGQNGLAVAFSLSPYEPRGREPATVRVSMREVVDPSKRATVVFGDEDEEVSDPSGIWQKLDESQRALVREGVAERRKFRIQPRELTIDGTLHEAEFVKEDVFFPFRPTRQHFMGLDSSGRDVFVRILYALRISLNFGLLLVVATMVVGVAIGGIQGYFGGKTDLLGQRAIEIWEALPFLYVMILMGSVFGTSFMLLLIVYGVFNWIGISYYMRGEFLKIRKLPFVEAAHCLGLPSWKIMARHILPNALVPVITFFPFSLVSAIGVLSALDYLGFGLPPPTPSWGELLGQAQEYRYAYWLALYPSLALFVVVLLGVFIGDGIRAAFDPRVSSRYES